MYEIKDYFEVKEASEVLGVCKKTIKNWEKKGFISSIRHPVSRYRLYKREDIQKLLNQINI
jgi:DNA (cytosine-5)-methyltransferase 1